MRYPMVLFVVGLLCCTTASAAIYRCTGETGEPEFRQQPCGGTAIAPATAQGGAAGVRASERAWLKARERADRRKAKPPAGKSPSQGTEKARKQAYQCTRKRRALDAVNAELRAGYRPAKGDRLRKRQRAYRDYLRAFCR